MLDEVLEEIEENDNLCDSVKKVLINHLRNYFEGAEIIEIFIEEVEVFEGVLSLIRELTWKKDNYVFIKEKNQKEAYLYFE